MTRYLLIRLGQMVIVFFGATFLIYAMVFLVPADPIAAPVSYTHLTLPTNREV